MGAVRELDGALVDRIVRALGTLVRTARNSEDANEAAALIAELVPPADPQTLRDAVQAEVKTAEEAAYARIPEAPVPETAP